MNDDLAKRLIFEEETEEERKNYNLVDYGTYERKPNCTYNYNIYEDYKNKKFYKINYCYNYDFGYSSIEVGEVEPVVKRITTWKEI